MKNNCRSFASTPWRALRAALWAGLLAAASGLAFAQQPSPSSPSSWYGGLSVGQTLQDLDDREIGVPGASASSLNEGQSRTGYKLFIGKRLARHFAIEGAYTDFGRFHAERQVTAPAAGTLEARMKVTGWSGDLVGLLPFDNGASLFAKLGLIYSNINTTYTPGGAVAAPPNPNPKRSELGAKWGGGIGYELTQKIGLRFEYEVAKRVGDNTTGEADVKLMSLGALYRF
jgi:opacity protein-like surface antigen